MMIKQANIVVFASGTGTNFSNLFNHFNTKNSPAKIVLLVSNNENCGAAQFAREKNIPIEILANETVSDGRHLLMLANKTSAAYVVLAGYLKKIPAEFALFFDKKIVNVHPSLLPKFGGKGMYGKHVHKAVFEAGEKETGITLHYVNADYDMGEIITQKKISLTANETIESIEFKIHALEKKWLPLVMECLILQKPIP